MPRKRKDNDFTPPKAVTLTDGSTWSLDTRGEKSERGARLGSGAYGAVFRYYRSDAAGAGGVTGSEASCIAVKFALGREKLRQSEFEILQRVFPGTDGYTVSKLTYKGLEVEDGARAFAMPYFPGRRLVKVLGDSKLSYEQKLRALRAACVAVKEMSGSVAHRDLHTGNILIQGETLEAPAAKVIDYGLAREVEAKVDGDEDDEDKADAAQPKNSRLIVVSSSFIPGSYPHECLKIQVCPTDERAFYVYYEPKPEEGCRSKSPGFIDVYRLAHDAFKSLLCSNAGELLNTRLFNKLKRAAGKDQTEVVTFDSLIRAIDEDLDEACGEKNNLNAALDYLRGVSDFEESTAKLDEGEGGDDDNLSVVFREAREAWDETLLRLDPNLQKDLSFFCCFLASADVVMNPVLFELLGKAVLNDEVAQVLLDFLSLCLRLECASIITGDLVTRFLKKPDSEALDIEFLEMLAGFYDTCSITYNYGAHTIDQYLYVLAGLLKIDDLNKYCAYSFIHHLLSKDSNRELLNALMFVLYQNDGVFPGWINTEIQLVVTEGEVDSDQYLDFKNQVLEYVRFQERVREVCEKHTILNDYTYLLESWCQDEFSSISIGSAFTLERKLNIFISLFTEMIDQEFDSSDFENETADAEYNRSTVREFTTDDAAAILQKAIDEKVYSDFLKETYLVVSMNAGAMKKRKKEEATKDKWFSNTKRVNVTEEDSQLYYKGFFLDMAHLGHQAFKKAKEGGRDKENLEVVGKKLRSSMVRRERYWRKHSSMDVFSYGFFDVVFRPIKYLINVISTIIFPIGAIHKALTGNWCCFSHTGRTDAQRTLARDEGKYIARAMLPPRLS